MIQLSERILGDAGGWQVFKQARSLHQLGRVRDAAWSEGVLQGFVREGQTEFRAGLRFVTRTNIENLCTCRDSRARGLICAHSVAVGLEVLKPSPKPSAPAPSASAQAQAVPNSRQAPESRPWNFSLGEGELVEIHLVLPPNLPQAASRNSISLGVECVARGRRTLLSALDRSAAYQCSASDLAILKALRAIQADDSLPGMLVLSLDALLPLLEAAAGGGRVALGRQKPLRVISEALRPVLFADTIADGSWVLRCELPSGASLLQGSRGAWILRDETLQPVCPGLPAPYLALLREKVTVPAGAVAGFVQREWGVLSRSFECERVVLPEVAMEAKAPTIDRGTEKGRGKPRFRLQVEGSLNFVSAKLEVVYAEFRTTLTSRAVSGRPCDPVAEESLLQRLAGAGFSRPDAEGQMVIRGEPAALEFFARHLPAFQRDCEVTIGERFAHVTRNIERIEPKLEVCSSGENWFELDVALATAGGERYSGAEIQRLIQSGRSHIKRKDGSVAVFDPVLLEEFQQVLRDCDPQQRQAGRYRIANRQAGFLQAFAEENGTAIQSPPHWRQWATASRQVDALRPVPLGGLEERLRSYQKQGVYWMHFLAGNGLGGILADEMGLGKTVQALTFLNTVKGRRLVVAPSSLLTNWQREAERFVPGIRVLVMAGAQRQERLAAAFAEADLVITSYPLLRRDIDWYAGESFAAVVLDEAQHIKNPDSQNAQAVFRLRADRRFVLTGTPVENSVRDVWSLFHFLMPGYLGTRADFRERYEGPISKEPGGLEHKRMIKRLAPFVLRRTKKAVASELPDKIEQVLWCELSPEQREAYGKLVDLTRREVSKAEGLKNQGQARMLMLTALLRLRQACNDLRLLGGEFAQSAPAASGKLEALDELLDEALEGGHRILLFSQFSSMLDLLQERLVEREVAFCRLDGSTRDRAAQVDRFQEGATPVFLISLKAGGVGLNLTAADTVVHFDPWWNPAVEAQATDRAHRIGQKSVVTSYKLITRATVEEKILQLQGRKRALMDALVESEQPLMDGLSMDDLSELLQG